MALSARSTELAECIHRHFARDLALNGFVSFRFARTYARTLLLDGAIHKVSDYPAEPPLVHYFWDTQLYLSIPIPAIVS